MSRSNSVGDLVPRDITEILALQSGKKKRGSSLGRAFSWFRGSKRKRSVSNGQSRTGGPSVRTGENSTPKQIHASNESSKAGQKQAEQGKLTVHYTASQHYQENVFIEGSRPQYLEDLHTEALEGLKILQQEEHKNEVDFQNDETVLERDVSSREGDESLETDSTAGQSVNSVSTVSAVSSRPVLTRQGSTFKPLNPVKRLDKTRRRPRRTTIMGIPQQVHKELSLARGTTLEQLPNGEHDDEDDSSGTVVIPTINGEVPALNHEGARVHLQNIEALQTSRDEELLKHHIQSVYQDDFALNRKLGPGTSPMQRPKSLAVSGMTTSSFLQEPQGPVMSISPQATYLSKIIPNAILPAAIDIIEINRDHNKCSGSMVSKSSLSSASPSSLRSRGGTNEDAPTTSQIGSHSQSSETIVSNSSTVSSKGRGPPTHATDSTKEVLELNPKDMSVTNSNSWISSDSKGTNQRLEHTELNDARENVRNSRSFSRSLSVMKTKLPPAPPQRTYSLHHEKIKRRSREQTEIHKINHMAPNDRQTGEDLINGKEGNQSPTNEKSSVHSAVPCSLNDSQSSAKSCPLSPDKPFTGSLAGSSNSSPQKTASGENKFDRTLSPSSGYSSQSGTPTHSPKEVSPSSPGKRRVKPSKPERAGVRTSPLVSVSSSMTSLSSVTSDATHQDIQTNTTPSEPLKILPPVPIVKNKVTPTPPTITLREVFNIPPPPKVKAPSPPPPETWVHNKRTFELLCGPGPNPHRLNLQKQQKEPLICKNQKTDTIPNSEQIFLEQQTSKEIKTGSRLENKVTVEEQNESIPPQEQMIADPTPLRHCESLTIHNNDKESPVLHVKEASQIIQTQDPRNVENQNKQANETVPKRELPTIEVDQSMLSQTNCTFNKGAEFHKTPNPKIDETDAENQRNCIKDISNHKPMQTLGIEVPEVNGISPPPSPPPAHHPPPPPAKKSSSFLVPTSPSVHKHKEETAKEAASLESSWPPPPPPMDEAADLMLEDQEELDFPPPPPSFTHEPFPEMSDNCHHESCDQQANIELLADSDVKTNLPTTVQDCTVTEGRQHAKPQSCNNISLDQRMSKDKLEQVEKITLPSLEAPPTEPTMLTQDSSEQTSPANPAGSTDVPLAPPLPVEDHSTVNFRRQLNLIHKDNKSKELLSRHKSAPMPKEDANIPLVTPSLLQMVRLRSVNVGEDPVNNDNKSSMETIVTEDQNISSQTTPQKPIRKSLTLKTIPPAFKPSPATVAAPSMCLQEAIRMKTAAMSSSGVPPALNLRLSSTGSTTSPVPSPKTPEGCDLHKSPASTASFIFSKSTKKVVIETPTPPEVQASLKHNLVAEIMQVSEPAKMMITNGTKKPIKVPPPVAKKPAHGTNPPNKTENTTADKTEGATNERKVRVEVNGQSVTVHSATKVFVGSQDQARSTETAC